MSGDEVLNQDIGNFTLDYVNRVRLIIPVQGNPDSKLFVAFRAGQRISKATGSMVMAAEIMEGRAKWFRYSQRKGYLITSTRETTQRTELSGQENVAENLFLSLKRGDIQGIRRGLVSIVYERMTADELAEQNKSK